jgi:hypothetical protein
MLPRYQENRRSARGHRDDAYALSLALLEMLTDRDAGDQAWAQLNQRRADARARLDGHHRVRRVSLGLVHVPDSGPPTALGRCGRWRCGAAWLLALTTQGLASVDLSGDAPDASGV